MSKTHKYFQMGLLFSGLLSSSLYGHDFWLEASPFYTEVGNRVDLSVHIGNEYVGDSLPNIASWYTDFSLYLPGSKTEIEGELGRDPAGYFTPTAPGTYVIGYQSTFSYVEIKADTFNKYLVDEGLQNAIDFRQENARSQSLGKENYIRHAKILVQAGDQFSLDNSTLNLGYELEIIPLTNPYRTSLNENLDVKILYKNQPAEDILLIAFSRAQPEKMQQVRTNTKGEARVNLNQSGDWLLKAVKILRIEQDKADWQSHWASLTFSVK
jgi:uncharacterized GH25 family protein